MKKIKINSIQTGFSLIELLVVITIIGIFSGIALVNLSSSWTKNRLIATTRDLENWISEQRRYAMTHKLTCQVVIDRNEKQLKSTLISSQGKDPCVVDATHNNRTTYDLADSFGTDSQKLSLIINHPIPPDVDAGICFSFRGFSEEFVGHCTKNQNKPDYELDGVMELKLVHSDLEEQRCIRIISPTAMIRDGKAESSSSDCRYDTAY